MPVNRYTGIFLIWGSDISIAFWDRYNANHEY